MLAVAVRLVLLLGVGDTYWNSGLSLNFGEPALHLAYGGGLSRDAALYEQVSAVQAQRQQLVDLQEYQGANSGALEPYTYSLPGYTILLAASYRLTSSATYLPVRLLTGLLDGILAVLVVYWLGRRFFGRIDGYIAALLYASSVPIAFMSIVALPDALVSLFILATTAFAARFGDTNRLRWALAAGASVGIGSYFRPDLLPLAGFITVALLLWRGWRAAVRFGIATIALWGALLIPWGLLQKQATGVFDLGRSAVGINVWEGIGEYANPCGFEVSDAVLAHEMEGHGVAFGTPEGDSLALQESLNCIRSYPVFYLQTLVWRFPRALLGMWSEVTDTSAMELVVWLLAVVAVLRWRRPELLLLLAPPLARSIPFTFIHVEPRWIVVGQGSLFVLAAGALLPAVYRQSSLLKKSVKGETIHATNDKLARVGDAGTKRARL